ncbi:hypothetical protein ABE509_02115 [[Pseudomonas] hibiscicola]|uniref:DUF6988 family protein n=1 Tax=Stenotrophomonas hibiscicola TaxID=86189 RepID=UPI00320B38FB
MNMTPIQVKANQVLHSLNTAGALASRLQMPAATPDRFRIAWALLRASFDDACAIAYLLQGHGVEMAGPAFTLLRPMNEKFKRGTWFGFCASDAEVQAFIAKDDVPRRNLAAEIEAHPPFDQYPIFTMLYDNAWSRFNSFTHGGGQLVGAYTLGDGIGAAFPEQDIINMLAHVEGAAVTAVHVMCMICGEFEPDLATHVLDELAVAFHPQPGSGAPVHGR